MTAIVLTRPRNPQNIGAVARAMSNFGLSDLRLVDVYPPVLEETVSAIGAEDVLKNAGVFDNLPDALKDVNFVLASTAIKARKIEQDVIALPDLQNFLKSKPGKAAIVFGPEKTGLTQDEILLAHAVLNIPTTTKTPSVNLAQAVILCCYELARGNEFKKTSRPAKTAAATFGENERLVYEVEKLFTATEFKNYLSKTKKQQLIRPLLQQNTLTKEQVFLLKDLAMYINTVLNKK